MRTMDKVKCRAEKIQVQVKVDAYCITGAGWNTIQGELGTEG